MSKKVFIVAGIIMLLLAGCAAGPNSVMDTPTSNGDLAGFWMGLWHGSIYIVTFIISLFSDSVSIYEVHNTGAWYNFGFILGSLSSSLSIIESKF